MHISGAPDTANSLGEDFLASEKVRLLQKPYAAEELFAAIRNAIHPPRALTPLSDGPGLITPAAHSHEPG